MELWIVNLVCGNSNEKVAKAHRILHTRRTPLCSVSSPLECAKPWSTMCRLPTDVIRLVHASTDRRAQPLNADYQHEKTSTKL